MIEEDNLTSFEAHLASLKPRPPRLDRDRLMFLAGQASVAYFPTYRPSSFRPAAISALVAAAVTLFVVTATQSGARMVDLATAASVESRELPATQADKTTEPGDGSGDSLGWVFSLLSGPADETDSTQSKPSLVQERNRLLKEAQNTKEEGGRTKEEGRRMKDEVRRMKDEG